MNGNPVDLRSDTVTRPSPAMRRAMCEAEVGDDSFGEDPTVRALEEEAASLCGHEAALYVPSGTMGNQIAVNVHVRQGDEVILDANSHIAEYELSGIAVWSGAMARVVQTPAGLPSPAQLRAAYRGGEAYDSGRTGLLALENTHMLAGGVPHAPRDLAPVLEFAGTRGVPVHLDGARLFNAAVALGVPARAIAAPFASATFCLSKGLGAPVGSCLAGSAAFIAEARRVRKRMGGGMRQAGILAAAGVYALRHNIARLAEDHDRARRLAAELTGIEGLQVDPDPPPTNIVMIQVAGEPESFVRRLGEEGVLAFVEGGKVRLVTHLDIDDAAIDAAVVALRRTAAALHPRNG
jgi:threonine aldolase